MHIFVLSRLEIRNEEGKIVKNPSEAFILHSGDSRKVVIPPDWIETTTSGPITYLAKTEKYFIKAIVSRKGPYYYLENGRKIPFDAWEGEVCSEVVIIEVKSPEGVDLEAYDYFKGDPLAKPDELLNKFPTSTYAAYVLAAKIPDYSDPLFKPVPPKELVRSAREEGKRILAFPEKDSENYFQQLDKASRAGNIPEPVKTSFYCFYGDLLTQRGRFAEAEKAFERAVEVEEPIEGKEKVCYNRAREFLAALKSKVLPNRKVADPKN